MVGKDTIKSLRSYFTSLTNTFSVLVVGATEVLVGKNVFKCPCSLDDRAALLHPYNTTTSPGMQRRWMYSLSFIFWPAIAAFFMAMALSGSILRCFIQHRCNHCNVRRHWQAVKFLLSNSRTVCVPPLAWIFIALMDGRYYTCAVTKLPVDCMPDVTSLNVTLAAHHAVLLWENQWHRCTSQIMALFICGSGITLVGLYVFSGYLCSKFPYYQRRYMQLYQAKEMETFTKQSEICLTKDLTAKWEDFLKDADTEDWENVSRLPTKHSRQLNDNYFYSEQFKNRWQKYVDHGPPAEIKRSVLPPMNKIYPV